MCHLLQRDLEQVRTTLQAKEVHLQTLTKERDECREIAATQKQTIEVHQVLCAHHMCMHATCVIACIAIASACAVCINIECKENLSIAAKN